jgi:hypothetical protein
VTVVAAQVADQDTDDPPDNPSTDHVSRFTTAAFAPVANDDAASTPEDTPVVIPVTANDSDPDGDLVLATVRILMPPAAGTARTAGDGTTTYAPNPDATGTDIFTYEVCDATSRCDTAAVTVTISPVDDPPIAAAPPPASGDRLATSGYDPGPLVTAGLAAIAAGAFLLAASRRSTGEPSRSRPAQVG